MRKSQTYLVLTAIIALGAFFRLFNLNWDDGHYFHPDERNIAMSAARIRFFDKLDPEFYAYGTVPIYTERVLGEIASPLTHDPQWTADWGKLNILGRFVSFFFSVATIPIVYFLALEIFPTSLALFAAWFTATTPILVQQAHYAVTESSLSFWAVLLTLLSLKFREHSRIRLLVKISILLGIAVGTKMSAISFSIIPLVAILWSAHEKGFSQRTLFWSLGLGLIFLSMGFVVYTLLSPYTFLSFNKFMESMRYEDGIVSGRLIVVYVYQFLGTIPYLYQVRQLPFTQGFGLGILSVGGYVWLMVESLRKHWSKVLFVFLWPTVYFLYVGGWYAKFVRYLVPIYPFLAISASFCLNEIFMKVRKYSVQVAYLLVIVLLAAPLLRSIAFMHIYQTKQTRVAASEWIYMNIPAHKKLLTEHWDDGLPIGLSPSETPERYQSDQLTIYEPDNSSKVDYYAQKLSAADYIIINSRRLYGTLLNLTEKYPVTSKYYKLLFNGSLRYTKVAEFAVYPTLEIGPWRWELNDDWTEETLQVYDHPKVLIFQNTGRLNANQLKNILAQ